MNPTIGSGIPINVDRLIETRALIMANSGAGKSWAIRRLLEQTHGLIQQIVLDVEDDFATLRERFDYVLAGKGGDCPADPRCAAMLARRLLELRVSAVINLYELKPPERVRFVRLFLEELVNVPKDLWHPAMVVLDEAHMFAPHGADRDSTQAVIDLMSRGRKRGFCGILATQRPAQLHADARASAINKLSGRFSMDIDVERAGKDLGFSRPDYAKLRALKPGQFFCVGPALCEEVTQIQVGDVLTSHPKAGHRSMAPPPPQASVRKVLSQLADLPAEAEEEARTAAELRQKIRELERQLAAKPTPVAPPEKVIEYVPEPVLKDEHLSQLKQYTESISAALASINAELSRVQAAKEQPRAIRAQTPVRAQSPAPVRPQAVSASPRAASLPGPQQKILDAIAWLEDAGIQSPENSAVAFLAGYTVGGGGYNNPRGTLRTAGLIEYIPGDRLTLTDAGREQAAHTNAALTNEEMHRKVLSVLPGPEQRILQVILNAYPDAITNEQCASEAGYTAGAGGYNNPRGRLRTLGLIEYPSGGMVVARSILFPEGI